MFLNMMAQSTDTQTAERILEIQQLIAEQPNWAFDFKVLYVLMGVIGVMIAMIYLRQQKIARNQVDLAKLLDELARSR